MFSIPWLINLLHSFIFRCMLCDYCDKLLYNPTVVSRAYYVIFNYQKIKTWRGVWGLVRINTYCLCFSGSRPKQKEKKIISFLVLRLSINNKEKKKLVLCFVWSICSAHSKEKLLFFWLLLTRPKHKAKHIFFFVNCFFFVVFEFRQKKKKKFFGFLIY